MTEVGTIYGQALYDLARSEGLSLDIWQELEVLKHCLCEETPDYLKLLGNPSLTKQERCQILDQSFRGTIQPYLLNFLKLLTEKGYIRHFSDCCTAYQTHYYRDNNILPIRATTALPLTDDQRQRLTRKLMDITGKHVILQICPDPACLGGIRLEYDGKQVDDTLSARLDAVGKLLKNTVL